MAIDQSVLGMSSNTGAMLLAITMIVLPQFKPNVITENGASLDVCMCGLTLVRVLFVCIASFVITLPFLPLPAQSIMMVPLGFTVTLLTGVGLVHQRQLPALRPPLRSIGLTLALFILILVLNMNIESAQAPWVWFETEDDAGTEAAAVVSE